MRLQSKRTRNGSGLNLEIYLQGALPRATEKKLDKINKMLTKPAVENVPVLEEFISKAN